MSGGGAARVPVSIQVSAKRFYADGVEASLDLLARTARVNVLSMYVHTYHAWEKRAALEATNVDLEVAGETGATNPAMWSRVDDAHYRGTRLRHRRTTAPGAGRDIFDDIAEGAARRGMAVHARWCDWGCCCDLVDGNAAVMALNSRGARTKGMCVNNPDTQGWWAAQVEDVFRLHPCVTGLNYGPERTGPLMAVLGGAQADCFCGHCLRRGAERGLDGEKAALGFREMEDWVASVAAGRESGDGRFVEFFRLLQRHPMILGWDGLWYEGLLDQMRFMYAAAKMVRPKAQVGWHIWHHHSFSPLFRAALDYRELIPISDYLKPVLYHECAGPRFQGWTGAFRKTVLGDLPDAEAGRFLLRTLQYDVEREPAVRAPEGAHTRPFSADYVRREVARCVKATGGRVPVWSGVGLGIPEEPRSKPGETYAAVRASFEGGAAGLLLSREFDEMSVECLAAVGRALADAGLTPAG